MACRKYINTKAMTETGAGQYSVTTPAVEQTVDRLLFGVDSQIQANDLLQNNIEQFEWVVRNKIYPCFYGRYLNGENCLTKDEIKFLHSKACRIAAIYAEGGPKETKEQGVRLAQEAANRAHQLCIPEGTAIFLEIGKKEAVSRAFLSGFAVALMEGGYTPAFKANTDSRYGFDRAFSAGMQNEKALFQKCLIWAEAPTVEAYNGITTSHLIRPDNWKPYAPSGITRKEIAVWQYGVNCHPIEDDMGKLTTFNLDLVRNEQVIYDKMF